MFPSGLSMLWESTDPDRALRERFGLESFEDAAGWLRKGLADVWGVDVQACDRILISDNNAIAWVRTDRGPLVAKWSRAQELFARFSAIADLLDALHKHGEPVPPPLPSVDGQRRVIIPSEALPLSVTLQPEVDGDLLDTADETAVLRAGACLAGLHLALADLSDSRLVGVKPSDLREQLANWLESADPGTAPAASQRLRDLLPSLPELDSRPQLIHGDYRASNVLTAGSEVAAVLDFDGVAWDYCISDLANAFVYLGTHFTNWQPTPPSVRETLLKGYESVRPLTQPEHQWLQALALWRGINAIPAGDDPAGWAHAVLTG